MLFFSVSEYDITIGQLKLLLSELEIQIKMDIFGIQLEVEKL